MASAFEQYLRTGHRAISSVETKFNPWHDPEDGRFTFAGHGRYFSGPIRAQGHSDRNRFRGGGRGGFGGGGATGSWEAQPAPRPSPDAPRQSRGVSAARPKLPAAEARLTVRKNGYEFSIDAHARTRRVSGEIRLQSQPRSRSAQANAGKPDRRVTDDGGHYIAARLNGPRGWFNHFAQDANFNRGAYRALEDQWAKAVRSGKRVFVDIVPLYRGTSMRPYRINVTWYVDGKRSFTSFPNARKGE